MNLLNITYCLLQKLFFNHFSCACILNYNTSSTHPHCLNIMYRLSGDLDISNITIHLHKTYTQKQSKSNSLGKCLISVLHLLHINKANYLTEFPNLIFHFCLKCVWYLTNCLLMWQDFTERNPMKWLESFNALNCCQDCQAIANKNQ